LIAYDGEDRKSGLDEANKRTKVRHVTEDDIGMKVLYEPPKEEITGSQAQIIE
jgi:hypothetical protein